MEVSFKDILESNHYADQKNVVFKAINRTQLPDKGYAPPSSLPHSSRVVSVDYSTFKHTPEEVDDIYTMKKRVGKSKHYKFKTLTKIAM